MVKNSASAEIVTYRYKFTFTDLTEKNFEIELDAKTLNLIHRRENSYPQWARLEYFKCQHCPLNEEEVFCPAAVSVVDLINAFLNELSYEDVDVEVLTDERKYFRRTTLQDALSSLIGIYMVTSGCPILEKLKPMVRFHLPFATGEETTYRTIAMYLLAQYFISKKGKKPDWELNNLGKLYNDIQIINSNFCDKLRNSVKDAALNAIVKLDYFASSILFLDKNTLAEIENYFDGYFK